MDKVKEMGFNLPAPAREIIFQRRSTRSFDPSRSVSRAGMEHILSAGLQAPSPKNRQPWRFYVADSREIRMSVARVMRNSLAELKKRRIRANRDTTDLDMAEISADIVSEAPTLVLIGYERDASNEHGETLEWGLTAQAFEVGDLQAIGAAVQNMLLQAEEMGIASLWMCDVLYAHDEIRALLNLKTPFVAAVAFGYEGTRRSARKTLDEKAEWLNAAVEDEQNV